MGIATALGKIVAKISGKGDDLAKGVAKSGDDVVKATSRATGVAARLTAGGTGGLLGAGLNSLLNQKPEEQIPNVVQTQDVIVNEPSMPSDDPTINVPELVQSLSSTSDVELPALTEQLSTVDLATTAEVPIAATVDPVQVVENYFDDNYKPIPVEASVPADTRFEAYSKSLGSLNVSIKTIESKIKTLDIKIDSVEKRIKQAIEQNKSTLRANERRRDEADVEKKKKPAKEKGGGAAAAAGAIAGGLMMRYILPITALLGSNLLSASAEASDDGETIGEKLSFLEDIEDKYVTGAAALAGAKASGAIGRSARAARSMAAGVAMNASLVADDLKTAARNVKTGLLTRASDARSAMQVSAPRTMEKLTQTKDAIVSTYRQVAANPKAIKVVQYVKEFIERIKAFADGFASKFDPIKKSLSRITSLFGNVFKGLLAKPIRWYVAIEGLLLLIPAAESWLLGTSTEQEFHTKAKESINRVVGMIGGTWIVSLLFTLAGAAVGTVALPGIGTIAGTALGIFIGLYFGESIYKMIGGEVIVNAIYDYIVSGFDTSVFNGLTSKMKDAFVNEWESLVERVKEDAASSFDFVAGGGLEVATTEDIKKEYGENISNIDLITRASSGLATDENAIAYALKDIKSEQEFQQFAKQYEQQTGSSLSATLQEELSENEYGKLMNQLQTQYEQALPPGTAGLLEQIARGEGTSDKQAVEKGFASGYDVVLGYGKFGLPSKPLSQMTLSEVKTYQDELRSKSGDLNSSAVGKYQIIKGTLQELQKELQLPDTTIFNKETQDKMAEALLRRRKITQYTSGEISREEFQQNLSREWASVADPYSGMSYYGQHTGTTDAQAKAAIEGLMQPSEQPQLASEVLQGAPTVAASPMIYRTGETPNLSVRSSIEEKGTQIIPIIVPLAAAGQQSSFLRTSNVGLPSRGESARSPFSTSDSFLSTRMMT